MNASDIVIRIERSLLSSRMASNSMVWAGSMRSSSSHRRASPNALMKPSRAFVRMARRGRCASPTPWMISRRRREDTRVQGSVKTRSCPSQTMDSFRTISIRVVLRRGMRYHASDKTEIIRLVEQSHLPARRTLEKLGIPRSSFYRWYDRHQRGGPEALADRPSRPDRVWNRIPEAIRRQIVDLALDQPELSPREPAVRFTDKKQYFVSEASVYRLLKAHRGIQGQDHGAQPALANRLHLSQGYGLGLGLGLVLSLHRAGRLLALHCRLEALRDDESAGRHRHARSGAGGFRARSDDRRSPTAALVG